MAETKHSADIKDASESQKANKTEQELNDFKKAFELEIHDLEERYSFLINEVKELEDSKKNLKESMQTVQENFQEINTNISTIMKRLDKLAEVSSKVNEDAEDALNRDRESVSSIISKPFRKLAVGTVSVIYAVTDKAIEGAASIKEGFEDIVAEAQYENKKRRMRTIE